MAVRKLKVSIDALYMPVINKLIQNLKVRVDKTPMENLIYIRSNFLSMPKQAYEHDGVVRLPQVPHVLLPPQSHMPWAFS